MKCSKLRLPIDRRIAQLFVCLVLLGTSRNAAAIEESFTFTASRSFSGERESGTVFVKRAPADTRTEKLNRPVIFVEGFDVDNKHSFESVHNGLNEIFVEKGQSNSGDQKGLVDELAARGHDVLFVDWADPFARLENNAYLLQDIITWANARLADDEDELQIVGCSMGGLVTRYALTDMEDRGIDHNTRTFISFDSPQKGANAPLGMQAMFRWMGKYMGAFADYYDLLSSMAAKQMLLVQIGDENSTERHSFFDRLASIGNYPMNLRKVAVANGNGHGLGQALQPHERMLEFRLAIMQGQTTYHGEVWAMPSTEEKTLVFSGREVYQLFPFPPVINPNKHYASNTYAPYDSVPGGMLDLALRTGNGMEEGDYAAIVDFIPAVKESFHSFIPTISALGLKTNDYFLNVAEQEDLPRMTPFNKAYFQKKNEPHLSISVATRDRFLDELAAIDKEVCDEIVANDRTDIQVAEEKIVVAGSDCEYVVESGGDAEFRASEQIKLSPGFWAQPGSAVRLVLAL